MHSLFLPRLDAELILNAGDAVEKECCGQEQEGDERRGNPQDDGLPRGALERRPDRHRHGRAGGDGRGAQDGRGGGRRGSRSHPRRGVTGRCQQYTPRPLSATSQNRLKAHTTTKSHVKIMSFQHFLAEKKNDWSR